VPTVIGFPAVLHVSTVQVLPGPCWQDDELRCHGNPGQRAGHGGCLGRGGWCGRHGKQIGVSGRSDSQPAQAPCICVIAMFFSPCLLVYMVQYVWFQCVHHPPLPALAIVNALTLFCMLLGLFVTWGGCSFQNDKISTVGLKTQCQCMNSVLITAKRRPIVAPPSLESVNEHATTCQHSHEKFTQFLTDHNSKHIKTLSKYTFTATAACPPPSQTAAGSPSAASPPPPLPASTHQ